MSKSLHGSKPLLGLRYSDQGQPKIAREVSHKQLMATRLTPVPHVIDVGTQKYSTSLPDVYKDISSIVGISKAPDPDNTNYQGGGSPTKLAMNGECVAMRVRLKSGKSRVIYCAMSKAQSAENALKGKNFGGDTIASARIPRRRRLG